MDSEGESLPLIHKHLMMPWNELASQSIQHPFHSTHPLQLRSDLHDLDEYCNVCGKRIVDLFYSCEICYFYVDLYCARYIPPEIIDISKVHHHKLTLLKEHTDFSCDECGKPGDFPCQCHECGLAFHGDCVWHPSELDHPSEVNHSHHPLHPLKLITGRRPGYSDGTCRLCGLEVDDRLFYHCSYCNFSLNMHCVLMPPPKTLLDSKAHHHQLTFLPNHRSFTCNACGLEGDRSPYICVQCEFIIHQSCLNLPRLININRHDHRIARTSVIGVVNSVCGVCHKKVDWTCGGYSCQKCVEYVVHSKCATTNDVWNGKELEGVDEEPEDTEPYVVIDDNTIQHFSHKEHYLKLNFNGPLREDNKHCNACTYLICLQSFYSCMDCDFILHQNCAELRKRKWHVLHNERLSLVTSDTSEFRCFGCRKMSNGFRYQHGNHRLDIRCGSVSEPFVHPSHTHPLYFIHSYGKKICKGCNEETSAVLQCIEKDSEFMLGFECVILPQMVTHRVHDHPLSLCYGEKSSGIIYWCEICEKKTNQDTWFYTCKDHWASLHTKCVLGDFAGLMPRSTVQIFEISVEVILNDSVSRPICRMCKLHCIYPMILKMCVTFDSYICSLFCMRGFILDARCQARLAELELRIRKTKQKQLKQ